jgi:DnaJ-class molecular chaperone
MNPYEVLGVARDATPAQVKAAYRRCSSKSHPDRQGGSEERMRDVNRANDILSDPAKRARFDATGDTGPAKSIDDLAEELLSSCFAEALDNDKEPVRFTKAYIADKHAGLDKARHNAKITRQKLEKRIGKTKRKGQGKNLVESVLTRKLEASANLIAQMDEAHAAQAKALEMLADYIGEEVDPLAGLTPLQRAQQGYALGVQAMADMQNRANTDPFNGGPGGAGGSFPFAPGANPHGI